MIYFCNTLVMVIVRAIAVLKYASGIGISAKRPLAVLRRIPTELWNDELQRLFDLMSHDIVALTGCRFFHLTKSLFLAVSLLLPATLANLTVHPSLSRISPTDRPPTMIS